MTVVLHIRWNAGAGAHLVNMTLYPEVPLAAELNIGAVTLAFVTENDATPSDEPLTAGAPDPHRASAGIQI